MPTPFTHLRVAQQLMADPSLPASMRHLLWNESGAFLLGSVAADARVGSGLPREQTHFYVYGQRIVERPWRVMVRQNPGLLRPHDDAHRAFVAGYVAHLTLDEVWTLRMVEPHFVKREWADRMARFFMLHIILIYMDERDLPYLESWQAEALATAQPCNWLSFAGDDDLRNWRGLICDQIKPAGSSRTLDIFGQRIARPPEELRAVLDSPEQMQAGLWDHIPLTLLADVEAEMYRQTCDQMAVYLRESGF